MATGLAVQGLGTGAMVLLPEDGGLALLLLTSGAMGFGHVLTVVSFITAMTSGLRDDEQGVAGGLSQLPQFLGAIGTACLAAIVTARTKALAATAGPLAEGAVAPQVVISRCMVRSSCVAAGRSNSSG
ncbi:hypothetical protein V2J94_37580 [Streptomyces sp. DSM 41524]|uniref:Major facilitator superfamily (MFS) profile domain-containing protein n=2 Tax=Streptomyces asiaticus TaxID=114695 RepID=A0ABU7Q808_9ACTN|nr:hypothetical protein [Streptomyces sp. DSM 41524]